MSTQAIGRTNAATADSSSAAVPGSDASLLAEPSSDPATAIMQLMVKLHQDEKKADRQEEQAARAVTTRSDGALPRPPFARGRYLMRRAPAAPCRSSPVRTRPDRVTGMDDTAKTGILTVLTRNTSEGRAA